MILAQVCPRYYPDIGGVETHVREISERLTKRGFKVEVLTTDPTRKLSKEDIINGVKIRRFKSWAPNENYHLSKDLYKYLVRNSDNYDIVHAHGYHDFPALYAAHAKNRNKLFFTPHYHGDGHTLFTSLLHIPYRFLGREIFKKAENIICVSNYEKGLIVNHFKIGDEKVLVIPNGVNLEEFKGLEKRKNDCRDILYVGRLEKYKGVQYLIRALPILGDDTNLVIVGKGPYKKSLSRLAGKLSIEDKVKFYQDLSRKELLHKYVETGIFALLSKHEAYGISVAEALASRTPCVVANSSALREWIDNKNCFGIDYPINVEKLARLIDQVIGREVVVCPRLRSWDKAIEELINLYIV